MLWSSTENYQFRLIELISSLHSSASEPITPSNFSQILAYLKPICMSGPEYDGTSFGISVFISQLFLAQIIGTEMQRFVILVDDNRSLPH